MAADRSTPRARAEQAFSKADTDRTASARRDAAFLTERRTKEAANLKRTLELKALRLAHEATLPPKPAKPARGAAKKKAVVAESD